MLAAEASCFGGLIQAATGKVGGCGTRPLKRAGCAVRRILVEFDGQRFAVGDAADRLAAVVIAAGPGAAVVGAVEEPGFGGGQQCSGLR